MSKEHHRDRLNPDPKNFRGFRSGPRDVDIIRYVYDHRYLTKNQIVALTGGNDSAIEKRLQALFQYGYLARRTDPNYSPMHQPLIHYVGKQGIDVLVQTGKYDVEDVKRRIRQDRELKPTTLPHALMIAQIHAVFTLITQRRPEIKLLFWYPDKQLYDNVSIVNDPWFKDERAETWPIYPDGFFGLQMPERVAYCMLEADRGTMDTDRFLKKLRAYFLWHQNKGHKKLGINSFIVLTVTESRQHAKTLFNLSRKVDDREKGFAAFWFTTLEQFTLEQPERALQNIWVTWDKGEPAKVALVQGRGSQLQMHA